MNPDTGRTAGSLISVILGLALLTPAVTLAEDDCGATLSVRIGNYQDSNEATEYQFDVEIGITSNCAVVIFDVVIETRSPGGEKKIDRQPGRIKLHDQQQMHPIIRYRKPLDDDLLSYEARLVRCESCAARRSA